MCFFAYLVYSSQNTRIYIILYLSLTLTRNLFIRIEIIFDLILFPKELRQDLALNVKIG
jgi:hypothetical protein